MSGHEIPQEPGRDRAWLSLVVITTAVLLAVFLGDTGKAVPRPDRSVSLSKRGVVVLKPDGEHAPDRWQIVRGTVVERGGSIRVVGDDGSHLIPRDRVEWYSSESTEVPLRYRSRAERQAAKEQKASKTKKPTTKTRKKGVFGVVVDNANPANVYVGRLVEVAGEVRIHTTTRRVFLSRSEVRWMKEGARGVDGDFWRKFPRVRVLGHKNPNLAKADDYENEAKIAMMDGAWDEATQRYAVLYKRDGFKTRHLKNLQVCVKSWLGFDPTQVKALLPRPTYRDIMAIRAAPLVAPKLDRYFESVRDRAEVKEMLGGALISAAVHSLHYGRRRSARRFAARLNELGGEYRVQGESILKGLEGSPPTTRPGGE